MTSKARELRKRMSIDPDAPPPAEPRQARRPPLEAMPAHADDTAPPTPDEPPASTAEVVEPAARPDPSVVPAPQPPERPQPQAPEPAAGDGAPASGPSSPSSPSSPTGRRRSTGSGRRKRGAGAAGAEWETALDDPSITEGHHGYRSFYVDDAVFARFRAAVYWTARRHDVTGAPDNMSVGVEAYMDEVAHDLERRYNAGAVFPPTPDQRRSHRKRNAGT